MVVITYTRALIQAFRSPKVFALYRKATTFISNHLTNAAPPHAENHSLVLIDANTDTGKKIIDSVQNRIIVSYFYLIVARELKNYQKSQISFISVSLGTVWLIFYTVITFAFIYFGMWSYNPVWFGVEFSASPFEFFRMSFQNTLFGAGSVLQGGLWPVESLFMLQGFLSFLILVIFLGIIVTVRNTKYGEELNHTASEFEKSAESLESEILQRYSYEDIDHLIHDLNEVQAGLSKIVAGLVASVRGPRIR